MDEISAVNSEVLNIYSQPVEEKEEECSEVAIDALNKGDGEQQMIAGERLQMVTMPNLRELNRMEEIKKELASSPGIGRCFYLYKELFILQLQAYQREDGATEKLAEQIRIARTDQERRQECIDRFRERERELFESYDQMIQFANRLSDNAFVLNLTHKLCAPDMKGEVTEPYQLYFLQILELEESLNFPVIGTGLIVHQVKTLTDILLGLEAEIKLLFAKRFIVDSTYLTLDLKEEQFYWEIFQGLMIQLLENLDKKWNGFDYNREKILNLIFLYRFVITFPFQKGVEDPIKRFFPYVLKHGTLDMVKDRFDDIHSKLPSWEKNYLWVELHIKAADQLLSSDPERAKVYFEKAKKLIADTLWSFSFSWNHSHWNEKQTEAYRQLKILEKNFQ